MTETAATSETTPKAEDTATATPAAPSEGVVEPQQQPPEGGETAKAPETPPSTPETKPTEAPKGAPETYEFKAPEGQTLDQGVMEAFEAKAREFNLTNEGAQSWIDSVLPKIQEAADDKLNALRAEWTETAKNDKEFGGTAFEANLDIANKAVKQFASEEFKALLKESGLSNHPEVIRFMLGVGNAISEDVLLSGGPRGRVPEDLRDKTVQAKRMYPEKNE